MTSSKPREIVAIGDVHGTKKGLEEILRHAGLIDPDGAWTGGNRVLVQTGDLIDRGRWGRRCYDLLKDLQPQARDSGGEVVMLIGNHELMVLQGTPWRPEDLTNPTKFGQTVIHDIMARTVKAAHAEQGYLFSHAGVRSRLRERLLGTRSVSSSVDATEALAQAINEQLQEAVRKVMFAVDKALTKDAWAHPIFSDEGVFWNRAVGEVSSAGAGAIRQVVGHSVHTRIHASSDRRIHDIDVAICAGGRAYLRVENGRPIPVDLASPSR